MKKDNRYKFKLVLIWIFNLQIYLKNKRSCSIVLNYFAYIFIKTHFEYVLTVKGKKKYISYVCIYQCNASKIILAISYKWQMENIIFRSYVNKMRQMREEEIKRKIVSLHTNKLHLSKKIFSLHPSLYRNMKSLRNQQDIFSSYIFFSIHAQNKISSKLDEC